MESTARPTHVDRYPCQGCGMTMTEEALEKHAVRCAKYQAFAEKEAAEECPDHVPDVAPAQGFICRFCGVALPSERGRQIHQGRKHKDAIPEEVETVSLDRVRSLLTTPETIARLEQEVKDLKRRVAVLEGE